ncbi:MAG: hypothetical protein PHY99_09895, partial [Bacteroidales bacterium]|nr:hypothetical protein [Bacteroidales bacterium]
MMRKIALVLFVIGLLIPSYTLKAQVTVKPLPTRDTLNVSRDSLVQLIRIKDSVLHRAHRDSVKMSNFISQLEYKSDSLYSVLNQSIYEQKVDSANRMRRYLS